MSEMTQASRDKLVSDLKLVMGDAEELLKLTANDASGKLSEVRARLGENLGVAKERLVEVEEVVIAKTKEAARATDAYVHEKPWQAVGIAAGVGFLLGMLTSRR